MALLTRAGRPAPKRAAPRYRSSWASYPTAAEFPGYGKGTTTALGQRDILRTKSTTAHPAGWTGPGITGQKPRFGEISTLTAEQQQILRSLMNARAGGYGGAGGIAGRIRAPSVARIQQYDMPTYAPVELAGAGERAGALSRMMAVSPGEEAAAIQRMSAPAMRQFREEILPGIRGTQAAGRTTWSTMRAGQEAKAGAGLAESLASLGEQYRMQRRGQAMQAVGLGTQEALGAGGLGMQRYGMEMQPALQAQRYRAEAALQRPQLEMQAQQLGMQGEQLSAEERMRRQQMLAGLLGIPMMGVYSY